MQRYTKLADHHIATFQSLLGSQLVMNSPPEQLSKYNVDWMKKYKGQSELVLFPQTSQQISSILQYCHQERLAVVPQGGNTGLVGGGVPVFDEIIISTAKMNKILDFDSVSGVVTLESGVILEQLDQWLKERGHICPLDLGAKGSCHLGGNVATNAGGLRLLRYGSLHGNVLGLEAVLPDGTILDCLNTLRKDNTGLDLKQLFIGSEGSLGIISKIALLAPQKPSSVQTAILQLQSYQDIKTVFVECRKKLNEILSAFEFWDDASDQLIRKHIHHARHPFDSSSPFTVLIETQGSHQEHDQEKIMGFLEEMMEKKLIIDGALAQDETQTQHMWAMREGIPEACAREGAVYKYDISLPINHLYSLVHAVEAQLKENGLNTGKVKVAGYGHFGDGNIHLNISVPEYDPKVTKTIEPFVYEWTSKKHGSISAEHGLGVMKAKYLHYSKSKNMIDWMKRIKGLFDPHDIMNPYKYIP